MNKRICILLLALLAFHVGMAAQSFSPVGIVTEDGGQEKNDTIFPGSGYSGTAPIVVKFNACVTENKDESSHVSEWRIYTDGNEEQPMRVYYEDSIDYTFDVTDSYNIKYYVTFTNKATGEKQEFSSDAMRVSLATSSLKVPNAFSPNGDGIHDKLTVSYQSIVKFDAYIFNRWGQELYHWGLDEIDQGWDGTYNGSPVKEGVYFILVDAKGADGVKYNFKKAVNLLRGFTPTTK